MPVVATLRVVPASPNAGAPRPERLRDAKTRLEKLGIDVVNVGHYSVVINTDEGRLEKVLGLSAPEENAGMAQNFQPLAPSLRGIVDRIEIVSPSQYLDV